MNNSSTTSEARYEAPMSSTDSSLFARGALRLVRGYQYLTAGRVSACRFYPSCSQYAAEAIEVHGALRGSALAMRRVLRCNPLGPHGVDLVPDHRETDPR